MSELSKRVAILLAALICASCADSELSPTYMGNTNWLTSCSDDEDCSDGLSCECGVCTLECETSADCNSLGAVCDSGSDALVSACGSALADSICLPECENDGDCGSGQCIDSHCVPAQMSLPDGGGDGDGDGYENPTGCGPNGAFVSAVVAPDQECVYSPELGANAQIPIGEYDVSTGFNGNDGACDSPYLVTLMVYSCLRGVDDTLQIHSAEIRLQDVSKATIVFDRFQSVLPNPFLVTSNATIFRTSDDAPSPAVATVEVIPTSYAEQLDNFDGEQLLAEITLFGTTLGDVDVELKPFTFPIRICDGCLTLCAGNIPADVSLDEIYGEGICRDNASADGRICIDASCTES
jgi:hypothetical protein